MTVKKQTRSGGYAAIIARQRLHNTNQQIDIITITKPSSPPVFNIIVGFNEKDQLQLLTQEEPKNSEDKKTYDLKTVRCENIPIDDITNCINLENYPNGENTLVFYLTKNFVKEAVALKFENNQDFKRIYFTYKYFKMRNRLTNPVNQTNQSLEVKKKTPVKTKKEFEKRKLEFDLHTTDDNGVTHISVQQKGFRSRFDQPLSLIGIAHDRDVDNVIYTDLEAQKPDKKKLFQRKPKATKDSKMKEYKVPDVVPKDVKANKTPDILMFRDSKPKRASPTRSLWTRNNNKGSTGYESDREEWRSSRSQFSTTAFDSLARPTKMAMALTLKKPQRLEPVPQYYRLNDTNMPHLPYRPNFLQRPRLPRPAEIKKNNLNLEHRKFTSLQSLDVPKKAVEPKKQVEAKKVSNITTKITGLTNKLRDLGSTNTIGRFKATSHNDVANLKPVLKSVPDSKRPVVRTCSAEPPKKVTFSAFATVQVV